MIEVGPAFADQLQGGADVRDMLILLSEDHGIEDHVLLLPGSAGDPIEHLDGCPEGCVAEDRTDQDRAQQVPEWAGFGQVGALEWELDWEPEELVSSEKPGSSVPGFYWMPFRPARNGLRGDPPS